MTITDPSIAVGDSIYELTSAGVTKVGTATANGAVTVTFTTDPTFMIANPNATTPTTTTTTPTTTTTMPTTTTTVRPTPSFFISGGSFVVKKNALALTLRCSTMPCAGTAEVTKVTVIKVKHGNKVTSKRVSAILAKATYHLRVSTSTTLSLRLTSAGVMAFAHAARHPVSAVASVSVKGGATRTKVVKVT